MRLIIWAKFNSLLVPELRQRREQRVALGAFRGE
jgi:hypothetical protein